MGPFLEQLSTVLGWLARSTMQVSILVCLILAVKAAVRGRLSARWHYCLWLLLLIRMVMPWAPESSVSVFNIVPDFRDKGSVAAGGTAKRVVSDIGQAKPETIDTAPQIRTETLSRPTSTWRLPAGLSFGAGDILALIWLGGALIFLVYVFATSLCVWIEIRCRRPLTNQKVLDLLEDCKRQMGIHTPVTVVENSRVGSPALFGFIRPRLLLPKGMLAAFGPGELRYVFLHELAHVKRYDIVVNWLMSCLQVLHWFNPLVWYAFYRMRADRELACDALALSRTQPSQSAEYGRTIVNLLERFSRPRYLPAMAGILESKSQLKRRITMIARFKKSSYRWSVPAVILLAVLSCVVLTNAQVTSQTKSREPKAMAKEFVELLVKGRFSTAARNFDSTMEKALPAEKLKEVWKSTTGQAGAFKRQIGIRTEKFMGSDIVFVTCEFKNGPLDVKVVYNNKRQISGLWFVPVSQKVLKGYQNSKSMVQIVTFRPKDGFSPKTAKDILDRFNKCVKFRVNTHHFRTEIREGKLYGSILTDSSAEGKALELMLNQCNELEFVNSKAADEQELAEHYAKGLPGLKTMESSRAVKFKNPQVVSTKPAAFANNVSAGLKKITVTFDQPMMNLSWSWVGGDDTYPKTTGQPRYNSSKTTCSLPVNLQPGKVYWVGINSARYKNFQTTEGVPAVPYVILFATKGKDGNPTPIPDNFIEEAKRINARAGKMSSQPERESGTVDIAIDDFKIRPYPEGGLYSVVVSIKNKGNITSSDFGVYFYRNDPDKRKPMTHKAGPIKAGDVWNESSMPFALKRGINKIVVVIDPDNRIAESDETNNSASMKVVVKNGQIIEKKVTIKTAKKATNTAGGKIAGNDKDEQIGKMRVYEVNRSVADFGKEQDFSTPEAAYAAINRVSASGDNSDWARVSVRKLAKQFRQAKPKKSEVDAEWAKVLLNARILEVRIWSRTRAMVAARLPQEFSSKIIRKPIDVRHLELENGRWLNAGKDRVWTIEAAKAINARAGKTAAQPGTKSDRQVDSPVGKWKSVDFVQRIKDFNPGEKNWRGKLSLKNLEFMRNGKTSSFFTWRKGWILHNNGRTKARYQIKEIDGSTYLFLPWLSGDVIERGQKPRYYVMEKM